MSDFQEKMKDLGSSLPDSVKQIVRKVLEAEHENRFRDDRRQLAETFANEALKLARNTGGEDES